MSWVRYPVWQHTFVSPSADSRGSVVSYWRKHVHEVLVSRLGGLGLPRESVVRLTDRPDMTLDVYRGRKTTTQQQQQLGQQFYFYFFFFFFFFELADQFNSQAVLKIRVIWSPQETKSPKFLIPSINECFAKLLESQ